MKYLNKIASVLFAASLGVLTLTSCEGSDLYKVGAPDWLAEMGGQEEEPEEELVGMMEDVYTIGATDFSTPWWAVWSKYYVIPEETKWNAQFTLNINPSAPNTYKNFAMIISNDLDRGAEGYKEYGAIRFDNQPSGNSEWGDYIDRGLVTSNLTFGSDTDSGIEKLAGKVTLTVNRIGGGLYVKITNGTVTKVYNQTDALTNLNADASNTNIRVFLCPEGSYINWLTTNIEPIGGCTSAKDKEPVSMVLKNVPKKVLLGTTLEDAMANVTAEVTFADVPTPVTVAAKDLQFEAIPSMDETGTKTLVAAYGKTYKGAGAAKPVIGYATFEVVDKMYTSLGATDNSTGWWGAHTEPIKIAPKETFVSTFTNYTSGANVWNNFVVCLIKGDLNLGAAGEYAILRADRHGWGNGYGACTATSSLPEDKADPAWTSWLAAMDGAKVTVYITNNGDGTATVSAEMVGNDSKTYTLKYDGINTIDPNDFYFRYTVDNCHLEFDDVLGAEDNTTGWWGAHTTAIKIPAGQTYTTRFKNYTSGANVWNNFVVCLVKGDLTLGAAGEYAILRADRHGWGNGYAACTATSSLPEDKADPAWATWLAAMDDAMVTVSITNNGDGTASMNAVMVGNDGKTYTLKYSGINTVDPNDFYFRYTVDNCHLVFE